MGEQAPRLLIGILSSKTVCFQLWTVNVVATGSQPILNLQEQGPYCTKHLLFVFWAPHFVNKPEECCSPFQRHSGRINLPKNLRSSDERH